MLLSYKIYSEKLAGSLFNDEWRDVPALPALPATPALGPFYLLQFFNPSAFQI